MPFYLIWKRGDTMLRGYDKDWVDGKAVFPITFPGRKTEVVPLTLRSSARDTQTFEILKDVKLYLTGADVAIVQEQWPYFGDAFVPARPEVNGGFEVSFDNGRTWIRFSKEVGYESNPATWVVLPASAIGLNGIDGQLGAFDQAHILVRYTIPPQATEFKVFDIALAADFDIA